MKKKKKFKKIKIVFYSSLFVITFILSINILNKMKFQITNQEFLKLVIENSNPYMTKTNKNNIYYYIVRTILNIDIENPATIFNKTYLGSISTSSDEEEDKITNEGSSYVEDPYPEKEVDKPLVYIYNTHQLEKYSTENIEEYDIVPNVMMASYILREKLYDNGIPAIVEDSDINEFLQTNNWNYASSYKVTRFLMEDAKEKNESLKYFIDLHRDSVKKSISTTTINGKSYAKILFIVGLENPNYKENLQTTEKINNMLEENYPSITRGIYKKQGPGVNGVYNQDFNKNTILIEMGGVENTIDEVLNSCLAVSEILSKYIKEDST